MCASQNDLVSFRTLQAIHDLRALACLVTDETLERIGAGVSAGDGSAHLRRLIFEQGCKLTDEDAAILHTALLLAATLPDDDHTAFVTSTAVLLADRLQSGAGLDDLYWHWDAFQPHYQLIEPAGRGAILHGYLRAHREGRVLLTDPPHAAFCTTQERKSVLLLLERKSPPTDDGTLEALRLALTGGDLESTARIWADAANIEQADGDLFQRRLIAAFRYLYEANESWDPYPGREFPPLGHSLRLIPVLPE